MAVNEVYAMHVFAYVYSRCIYAICNKYENEYVPLVFINEILQCIYVMH